jgi:hypothetical protein
VKNRHTKFVSRKGKLVMVRAASWLSLLFTSALWVGSGVPGTTLAQETLNTPVYNDPPPRPEVCRPNAPISRIRSLRIFRLVLCRRILPVVYGLGHTRVWLASTPRRGRSSRGSISLTDLLMRWRKIGWGGSGWAPMKGWYG